MADWESIAAALRLIQAGQVKRVDGRDFKIYVVTSKLIRIDLDVSAVAVAVVGNDNATPSPLDSNSAAEFSTSQAFVADSQPTDVDPVEIPF